ncbi:MAG: hypothetical protein QNJ51_18585 [Calothrix sp. MO_167.B12]|nr:hypothetical protein [Calothrix sp. MO_167.B12]
MAIVSASQASKQEIMQAFQQIVAEQKNLASKITTKEQEAEKGKNQEIIEVAATYTVDSIVKGIADLQLEFGGIIKDLSEKVSQENYKLDELNRAIEFENKYLKELEKIRIVADVVDVLTKEHQEKITTLEQEIAAKQEILGQEINQKRKDWEKEQSDFEVKLEADNNALIKERNLENEEYEYKLENTSKINANAYEAKKRNLERELQEETELKEKDWSEREKNLNENKKVFAEYQQKIASFSNELEEAVKKAREEAIKETHNKAKVEADLYEKEWQGTKQSYELKIQALEENIEKQAEQIENISAQLQSALQQAQDLAMRAFQSSTQPTISNK